MGCDLEYIQSSDHPIYSHFLSHTYITHNTLFFSMCVFIPFTSIPLCLFSLLLCDPPAAILHRLYYIIPCRAVLLLNILFILVLILTCLSITDLLCGISFSLGHVTAGSSLPVGRRVNWGPCRASAGARDQRSPTACWRYRATSTAAYRFWTLLAQASWTSKHHLAQLLQQVVLLIFKGQLIVFPCFLFLCFSLAYGARWLFWPGWCQYYY